MAWGTTSFYLQLLQLGNIPFVFVSTWQHVEYLIQLYKSLPY